MANDPAVYWYFQDYLMGTRHMNYAQKGVYVDLLCEQADSKTGSISEKHMNKICQSYVLTYEKDTFSEVLKKFHIDENGYYNVKMREVIEKRRSYSKSRSCNRKGKTYDYDMKNICETHDQHMENVNENIIIEDSKEKKVEFFSKKVEELSQKLMEYFGFTEMRNFDKLRSINMFLNKLEKEGQIDHFEEMHKYYILFKEKSGLIRHMFEAYILNEKWKSSNWKHEYEQLQKKNGEVNKLSYSIKEKYAKQTV